MPTKASYASRDRKVQALLGHTRIPNDVMIAIGRDYVQSNKTGPQVYEEYNIKQYKVTLQCFQNTLNKLGITKAKQAYVRRQILKIVPPVYNGKPKVDLVTVSKRYYDLAEQLIEKLETGLNTGFTTPNEFKQLMTGFTAGMKEIRSLLGIPENARMSARQLRQARKAPPERAQIPESSFVDESSEPIELNGNSNGEVS